MRKKFQNSYLQKKLCVLRYHKYFVLNKYSDKVDFAGEV